MYDILANIEFEKAEAQRCINALNTSPEKRAQFYHSEPYLFTTENLTHSFNNLPCLKDKEVLTVASSGDHAFEVLFRGAKKVTTFDSSPAQKWVQEVKSGMIRGLSYSKFMDFFFSKSDKMNPYILAEVADKIPEPAKMLMRGYYRAVERLSYFHDMPYHACFDFKPELSSYLVNEQNYNKMQDILRASEIRFIWSDLNNLPHSLEGEYDLIHLSNIYQYFSPSYEMAEPMVRFCSKTANPVIKKHLKPDGTAVFCYLYGAGYDEDDVTDYTIHNFNSLSGKISENLQHSHKTFESAQMNYEKDTMLLITKGR